MADHPRDSSRAGAETIRRQDLEHLIRACATIVDDDELVIVGSQAILGQFPDAPAALLGSIEASVFPRHHPERADLIDGAVGEGSPFHDTFGYYAHAVGPETAVAPTGWEGRLVPVSNENTRGATGWCLEAHDLVLAKCVAGRERDLGFAGEAIARGLVELSVLFERLDLLPVAEETRARIARFLDSRR